jgi:hypothetical protein
VIPFEMKNDRGSDRGVSEPSAGTKVVAD